METSNDKHWRVDKHIPIAVLVGIFMQFMAFVWYAAKIDSVVEQVPVLDRRVNAIETSRFTPQDAENWRRTIISEIKAEIAPLVEKVARHDVDIRRSEDRIHKLEGERQ
jgi:hypothetical protein